MSTYRHRQVGWIHRIVGTALGIGFVALFLANPNFADEGLAQPGSWIALGIAGLFLLTIMAFRHLDTEVTEDELRASFGPLPLFRRGVQLSRVRAVRPARSTLIDGYGIHGYPGRGWIWNVAGRDVVVVELDDGRWRLGTDDPEGLMEALRPHCAG